jgi:hypothetical protein
MFFPSACQNQTENQFKESKQSVLKKDADLGLVSYMKENNIGSFFIS